MQKLLTLQETADLLNLHTSTLYGWVHRRKIPYVKLGGKLGFIKTQIQEFIDSKVVMPNY